MVLAIKKNTYGVRGTGLAFAIYSCPQNSYFVVFFASKVACLFQTNLDFPL